MDFFGTQKGTVNLTVLTESAWQLRYFLFTFCVTYRYLAYVLFIFCCFNWSWVESTLLKRSNIHFFNFATTILKLPMDTTITKNIIHRMVFFVSKRTPFPAFFFLIYDSNFFPRCLGSQQISYSSHEDNSDPQNHPILQSSTPLSCCLKR